VTRTRRVGVIADTHGLLRPEARDALAGTELILHAGDVGSEEVLAGLRQIAPVVAVRGNVDVEPWAAALPETEVVEAAGHAICVLHDENDLDLDPRAAGFDLVVAGHSHRPSIEVRQGVLRLNPGSAGPQRFRLPVTVALVEIGGEGLRARHVALDV
jgi:hypothetical protein